MERIAWIGAVGLLTVVGGCGDADEGFGPINASVPDLQAEASTCIDLGPRERVLSSSPEGDLWVVDEAVGAIRVIQPDGTATSAPIRIEGIDRLQAWSAVRATALVDGSLYAVDDDALDPVRLPIDVGATRAFCGDPTQDGDGFVVADGVLERAAGQWWRWSPARSGSFGEVTGLGFADGACRPVGGALWLAATDAVWRVDAARAARYPGIADTAHIAPLGPGAPAILGADGTLRLGAGGGLVPIPVEAGAVDALDATTDALFAVAGGEAFRLDARGWQRLVPTAEAPGSGVVAAVFAHDAGGVWTRDGDTVCHHALGPLLRLRGVRPAERRLATSADLVVESDLSAGEVEVRVDGERRAEGSLDGGRFGAGTVALGDRGPHTLEVTLTHPGGSVSRRVPYDLHPVEAGSWALDVQPIFSSQCAGGTCHGPDPNDDGRPDLSTYEGWVENADTIRRRVGEIGDMPPPDLRTAAWGPDEVETIVAWIDGGMERGE